MKDDDRLIIVGAGCGGIESALAARANGWRGPITVFGSEKEWPYHRPPLSKAFLKDQLPESELALRLPAVLEKDQISLVLGETVKAIDVAAQTLALEEQASSKFDKLILATGGRVRRLPMVDAQAKNARNIHYLRQLEDARHLADALRPDSQLLVIGGGYVGLEVASTAIQMNCCVTVVEASDRLLGRVTCPAISDFLRAKHSREGVTVHTDVQIDTVITDDSGEHATGVGANGRVFHCDSILVAVGQLPNVELAAEAGLEVSDGIIVDDCGRTSASSVFAVGDCTRFTDASFQRSVRLESVPNALAQARKVGAAVCGKPLPKTGVPWFWSDQYDLQLKMAGISDGHDQIILRGDPASERFSAFYLKQDRLMAADTVNCPAEFMVSKKIIESKIAIQPSQLSDESLPINSVLAQCQD